mmetsp:Transcript_14041/g.25996  ORF Transcript_14041/g.25996 Transcript_14041/m.25996 type:complete len:207 (-) Transcript_14041:3348-3968(-)
MVVDVVMDVAMNHALLCWHPGHHGRLRRCHLPRLHRLLLHIWRSGLRWVEWHLLCYWLMRNVLCRHRLCWHLLPWLHHGLLQIWHRHRCLLHRCLVVHREPLSGSYACKPICPCRQHLRFKFGLLLFSDAQPALALLQPQLLQFPQLLRLLVFLLHHLLHDLFISCLPCLALFLFPFEPLLQFLCLFLLPLCFFCLHSVHLRHMSA